MNTFRAVDVANDWVLGSGVQSYATKDLAINYDVRTKLQMFLTECFFDTENGVPWFQLLGAKDKNALILSLKQVIINIEGVTEILSLDFTLDGNRNATVRYVINTIFSTQVIGTVNL